jgi:hypothetical protein
MKNVKEIFMLWSKSVDINVYTKMLEYSPNYKVQFIWLLILLGSTGGTFYFISKSILDYLNYDVVSKTNLINEFPAVFPTVTFCDNNPFSTKYSESVWENVSKRNGTQGLKAKKIFNLALLEVSSNAYSDEQRKRLGLGLDQVFSCTFNSINCLNDLHWYWSFDYGNCWQFNSGLNLTNQKISLKESNDKGIYCYLSIEIFPLFYENKYFTKILSTGMVVFVHNNSFNPTSNQIFIEPGKLSTIQVERTFIQKHPYPYSDCIDLDSHSSEFYDYIKNLRKTYRQNDCLDICTQKSIINECKCYATYFDNLSTTVEPCLTQNQSNCSSMQFNAIVLSDCRFKFCPLECETVKYDLSVSSQTYPSKMYYKSELNNESNRNLSLKYLNQGLTFDLMREHSLSFNVYYSDLSNTILTESPKTSIADLFSQIGGGLGLFVSFSVFTLFEFIELFILVICGLLAKTKSPKSSFPPKD